MNLLLIAAGITSTFFLLNTPSASANSVSAQALQGALCGDYPHDEIITTWKGHLYLFENQERPQRLFGIVGYNVSRCLENGGKTYRVGRELNYYTDANHQAPVHSWTNPLGEPVRVVHVANGPVVTPMPQTPLDSWEVDQGHFVDVPVTLFYPHPLAQPQYAPYNTQPFYQAGEFFNFLLPKTPLPFSFTWTRIGPLLPWMKMPQSSGYLVYKAMGSQGSWEAVPAFIKADIQDRLPSFRHAPSAITGPSQSSWTYFKAHVEDYEEGAHFPLSEK